MSFRFIHTSDWQIGKVFRFADDATMGVLQEARLEAVTRLGELAQEHGAGHVLVAGDVYEKPGLSRRTVNQALERMRAFVDLQWHLLPGNHDFQQPNGLWDRLSARGLPPNVRVHAAREPALLDGGAAAILPAPLEHRRALGDPTAWMDDALTPAGAARIGLAHGSVRGFGSDDSLTPNRIDPDRPQRANLAYLALGDWHGQQQVNDRCWYSGTPETDAFDVQDGGRALLVEIDGSDELPRVTPFETGGFRWLTISERLYSRDDIARLERRLRGLGGELRRTLVRLEVEGALSFADTQHFDDSIVDGVSAAFAVLRVERDQLYAQPTLDDLDRIDRGGVVRAAADHLRALGDDAGDEGELAREALHRLYVEYMKLESAAR